VDTDFASVARLLASPARSAMVSALLDGRALTATELARRARIAPSTASEHLAELTRGGLTEVLSQGRHRYYRVAGADVAEALEAFARICPPAPVRSLRASTQARSLAAARVCYDHVAGDLGVRLHDAMVGRGWLADAQPDYLLTDAGADALVGLGVDVDQALGSRRRFAYPCLDWTSRRFHLAGALAAELTATLLSLGWVEHTRAARGLRVTAVGAESLAASFGVDATGA
jgi:DNA-binding transcriptional ArsR family regulator